MADTDWFAANAPKASTSDDWFASHAPNTPAPEAPITPDNWRQAVGRGQVIFSNRALAAARDNAPAIGGAIGTAVAGPAGAAVGGATGAAVRDMAKAAQGDTSGPTTALGAAGDVAGNALLQGAITKGGDLVTAGMRAAAPQLMESAVKPPLEQSVRALKYGEVPPVVKTLFDEGVNVTRNGIAKLNEIISGSAPFDDRGAAAIAARNAIASRLAKGSAPTLADAALPAAGAAIGAVFGGPAGAGVGSAVGFLTDLVKRSPAVQSMLARGLYQSAAHAAGVPAEIIRAAVAAVASATDQGAH